MWSPGPGSCSERTLKIDSGMFGECNQHEEDGSGLANKVGLLLVLNFAAILCFYFLARLCAGKLAKCYIPNHMT